MDIIERIARVLTDMRYSGIADASPSGVAGGDLIDLNRRDFRNDALAVPKTLGESNEAMIAAAGVSDAETVCDRAMYAAAVE